MKALLSHDQTAIWPRLCLRDEFWPRKKWESVAQMQRFPVILSLTYPEVKVSQSLSIKGIFF